MKRKSWYPIFLLLMATIMSACQPTPIQQTAASVGTLDIANMPNRWIDEIRLKNATCIIDSEIVMPAVLPCRSFTVKKRELTAANINHIVDHLLDDATGMGETVITKKDILSQIQAIKEYQSRQNEAGGSVSDALFEQQEIQYLEDMLAAAPDAVSFQAVKAISQLPCKLTYQLQAGREAYVAATQNLCVINLGHNDAIQTEGLVMTGDAIWGEPVGTKIDDISISRQEAISQALSFVRQLDIQHLGVADAVKARIVDQHSLKIISKGWIVSLARNDGNNVPTDFYHTIDLASSVENDYAAPFFAENLSLYFDETGLRRFEWSDPVEVVAEKEISLIDFSYIQEQMCKYIKYCLSWTDDLNESLSEPRVFYRMDLASALLPVQDKPNFAQLVPVWVLYSNQNSRESTGESPYVICLNAIDGSRVDPFPRYGG